jgi:hypothetical protein
MPPRLRGPIAASFTATVPLRLLLLHNSSRLNPLILWATLSNSSILRQYGYRWNGSFDFWDATVSVDFKIVIGRAEDVFSDYYRERFT